MITSYNRTGTQIPIVILQSDAMVLNDQLTNRTVKLITEYYNLESNLARYLKIKVKPSRILDGVLREVIVYRLFRDQYLYETDRLFIDETFTVVREEKNIKAI